MNTPHEYTEEEVRAKFLRQVRDTVDYWDASTGDGDKRGALEGLAFSLLVMLDGGSTALPGFAVIPAPHPDDKSYCIGEGENWYPQFSPKGHCDIAGSLHELLYAAKPKATAKQGES